MLYQTEIFSSFIFLLLSVSIKLGLLYILEEKELSLSVLEIDEHNDFIHFSLSSLNVPPLAFSPMKTSVTISYISVSLTLHFTNLCNTSKSHFKFHATDSGNFVNIFYVFQSRLDLRKKNWFRFYRKYLEFRRNVEISLKFVIKLQSFSTYKWH